MGTPDFLKGEGNMLVIRLICVGRMRERYFTEAFHEYEKRLGAYCRFECVEVPECRLSDAPSAGEISAALEKESVQIVKSLYQGAYLVVLCIEGKKMPSEGIADLIRSRENSGRPKLCFVIGGSFGLADSVKQQADLRLSMSDMTFPHHLARVMLSEQIYRGFKINEGSAYHK